MKIILPATMAIALIFFVTGCSSERKDPETAKNTFVLTAENFEKEAGKGVVMIDFWATWCMPCREFAPAVEKIAEQTAGKVKVCKVDTDTQDELSYKFGIHSIPTVIILKDGAEVERFIGVQSEDVLLKALGKYTEI